MADLEYWPQNLTPLLPLVGRVFGVLHLVAKLEESVLDIFETVWRRLSVACCSYGRHGCGNEAANLELVRGLVACIRASIPLN
jgi:hypothetical protein